MSEALLSLFFLVVGCNIDAALSSCNASVLDVSATTVTLSWHHNCSVLPNVSYSVTYNGTAHCGEILPLNLTGNLSGTNYTVMDLEEFTQYMFILTSSDGVNATAQAFTKPAVPTGKPQELRAECVTDDTVGLAWKQTECLDRNGNTTHYVVQYSQGRGDETTLATMGVLQSYTVSSLVPNTTYCFQVAVVNSNGTGPFSDPISITTLAEGTLPCRGVLGNLSCGDAADGLCYTASYAVQPDDSVTFTVSARTPGNTWVGLGVSDDQFMANSDVVLGAADGTNSFIHDRFTFEQAEPPVDASQDISCASAEHVDGVTTITFNRPRNSGDSNDISLDPCRFFLFAYSGRVNFFATPPVAIYHGFGPTHRAASVERICIPTFTECSAVDDGSGDPTSNTTVAESPSSSTTTMPETQPSEPTENTSSSSVGLAAGAAVAGVAVLIILTVAVVVLVVRLQRQRQKYKFCEKEKAESPLQLSAVSPLPNEAIYHDVKYDEIVESSTQQGDATYATVGNTSYEAPSPGYAYVHPSGANSEVTRAKRSQVTGSTLVENQYYAGQKKDQLTAPTIEPYQEELQVSEGERVTLMAGASGSPQPTITWVYMGREVEADCATELGEDGSLTLVCAKPKHAGTYHFTASNEAGSVESSVTLIVCTDEEQGEGGTGLATVESSPLEVEWFGEGVSHLHACNNAGFILQYQSLPSGEVVKNLTTGTSPLNQLRNRFNNIIAYDSYRIVLEPVPNLEHDYINASYIDGHSKPKKYIATQGPLPNTVTDFWRLVWQENVQAIAMLTNITEGYQKKCEQYWPQSKQSEEYWPFEVTVVDQMVFADYTVRTMQLEQSGMVGVRKKVVHFHFTSWPDHGVPEYAGSLLVYLRRIKAKYKPSKGPLLVHCSAGVGRTGTLIAIDTALEQAAKEGMVDIVAIVCRMRDQRMKMVQTAEQYIFIHDAVLESLVCGDTLIPSFELRKTTERLSVKDELTGKTGFEMQLHVLDQVTPNPNEVVRSAALNNREKNRNMDFLPPDNWRVVLKAVPENYIHASYANGYKQNKRFIIAQPPMRSTVCDFWKMVYERECGVIVMLSDNIEDQKGVCFPYWPKANKIDLKYGGYAVSTSEFHEQDGYTRRTFTITGPQSDEVHKVTQFQMTGWSSEGLCTDHKALIVLVGEVTTEQMRTGNKSIVVHGSDTVSRSGIFCAFMNAMECCKTEGTVDVFQVVRALRIQKPGAVPTVEQYCSIFDLMFLFLDKFDVYSNFK